MAGPTTSSGPGGRPILSVNAVFLEATEEGATGNAENGGGAGAISVEPFEDGQDVGPLEFGERHLPTGQLSTRRELGVRRHGDRVESGEVGPWSSTSDRFYHGLRPPVVDRMIGVC